MPLSPYEGPPVAPGTKPEEYPPELVAFMRRSKATNSAWVRKRRVHVAEQGRPWPDRTPPDVRPAPWLYDDDPEGDE